MKFKAKNANIFLFSIIIENYETLFISFAFINKETVFHIKYQLKNGT